ncbi:hypothetical protein BASA50_008480 [Batrachochytrium salamandrivorans]|uniref:Uncharacterized protein n=1 Tax=Batrachochytrium salamandrivorans TaxID=1357716 RepID=A0ABQ8F764_9FUNG|nr:hypothetical protein BASA50_008480 [Batrachochytrium salamandrivorans]
MGKKEEMYLQYTNFVIKANHNKDRKDFRFLMLEKGTKTILQFWLVDGLEFPQLRDLALQVFRNSLGSEKVKKLVYIKTNASQFGNQNMKDLVDTETESESEVERD